MLTAKNRVAILLHEGIRGPNGKTGLSILRYGEAPVVAVIDRECVGESLQDVTGIPRNAPIVASVEEALSYAPDVLIIGIAPSGGVLPNEWFQEIRGAIASGLSIVNGLHTRLGKDPDLQALLKDGQWIWDVRQEPENLGIAAARARNLKCRRVLTVGTDMSVGKMSTSLELNKVAQKRGLRSKFLATGQAGMMIVGDGIALDAVRVDFAAGAVEKMVMEYGENYDILFIEGQGSFLHPGSTATLPLMRGSQPTHLILVHRAGQVHVKNNPHVLIPPIYEVVKLYETVALAGGAFAPVKVAAIALNTHHLDAQSAQSAIEQIKTETGLPCTDPVRFGADILLDAAIN